MHEKHLVHVVCVDGDSKAKVHQENGTALFPSPAQQVSRLTIKINDCIVASWCLLESQFRNPD
jgi:hypothetical protein